MEQDRGVTMERKELGENCLAVLRIMLGWMMIWGFLDKMFGLGFETPAGSGWIDGTSPSSFVVYVTGGIFKDLYTSLAGNTFIDILMMSGMLILGITLIFGFASKLTTIATCMFMLVMYSLHVPPTDNPVVDYHLVFIGMMVAIYLLGGFERISVCQRWKEWSLVRRFPILE
jgi:thiosulfate dehydrogenase [quinone] large subunit